MQNATSNDIESLLTAAEAAQVLTLANPRSLAAWRSRGYGPAYVRIGKRRIRYRYSDLLAYLARRTVAVVGEP